MCLKNCSWESPDPINKMTNRPIKTSPITNKSEIKEITENSDFLGLLAGGRFNLRKYSNGYRRRGLFGPILKMQVSAFSLVSAVKVKYVRVLV